MFVKFHYNRTVTMVMLYLEGINKYNMSNIYSTLYRNDHCQEGAKIGFQH